MRGVVFALAGALIAGSAFAGGPFSGEKMVDLKELDRTIQIELRYASADNVVGKAIYPPEMKCLLRSGVAERIRYAQHLLQKRGYGLKIWDAYRPPEAHRLLWRAAGNADYLGDPAKGGSLHSWGVAVDATLVDRHGRELKMPTDFDNFTDDASMHYDGTDAEVRANLRLLQGVMGSAGFLGMRREWWHFVAKDWRLYSPRDLPAEKFARELQ